MHRSIQARGTERDGDEEGSIRSMMQIRRPVRDGFPPWSLDSGCGIPDSGIGSAYSPSAMSRR